MKNLCYYNYNLVGLPIIKSNKIGLYFEKFNNIIFIKKNLNIIKNFEIYSKSLNKLGKLSNINLFDYFRPFSSSFYKFKSINNSFEIIYKKKLFNAFKSQVELQFLIYDFYLNLSYKFRQAKISNSIKIFNTLIYYNTLNKNLFLYKNNINDIDYFIQFYKILKENIYLNIKFDYNQYLNLKYFKLNLKPLNLIKFKGFKFNLNILNSKYYILNNINKYNIIFRKLVKNKFYRRYKMKDHLLACADKWLKFKILKKIKKKNIVWDNTYNNKYALKYYRIPVFGQNVKKHKLSSYLFFFLKRFYIFFRKLVLFKNLNNNNNNNLIFLQMLNDLWFYLIFYFKIFLFNINKYDYIKLLNILKFKVLYNTSLFNKNFKIKIRQYMYLKQLHKKKVHKLNTTSKNWTYFFNYKEAIRVEEDIKLKKKNIKEYLIQYNKLNPSFKIFKKFKLQLKLYKYFISLLNIKYLKKLKIKYYYKKFISFNFKKIFKWIDFRLKVIKYKFRLLYHSWKWKKKRFKFKKDFKNLIKKGKIIYSVYNTPNIKILKYYIKAWDYLSDKYKDWLIKWFYLFSWRTKYHFYMKKFYRIRQKYRNFKRDLRKLKKKKYYKKYETTYTHYN